MQARFVTELRFALTLNPFPIYLLSFAEAGNVWSSLRTADPFGLKRSAGFGLRMLLQPIGLLGFDVGYGFDDDPSTPGVRSGWQFHFQFGR
jgi:outer membrane protein insertion porin family